VCGVVVWFWGLVLLCWVGLGGLRMTGLNRSVEL
jgi:hypothetical protein